MVKIEYSESRAVQVTAWRGITSGFDVFYAVRPKGDDIVADHFRNIVSRLPLAEQTVSDERKVDHLIFWTVPGTGTYRKNISRLGCRQWLRITEADDQAYTSRFDRIEDEMQERAISDHVHNVDTAMEVVLAPLRSTPNVVNLFLGGVDSTLIQTYLGNSVPAVYVKKEGATNSFEAEYASRAAEWLGIELENIEYDSDVFLDDLEVAATEIGMPPRELQYAFFKSALSRK